MIRSRLRIVLGTLLVVSAVLPAPASAGTYSGTWDGKTKQGQSITFKVNSKNKVTFLKVGYEIQGSGCSITATTTLKKLSAPIVNGKFTVKSSSSNGSLKVQGTMISTTKAKGSLKAHQEDPTGFGCEGDARTSWTAKR